MSEKRVKVCHVIFMHSIFDGRVFHKEALSMVRAGYEVTILAPTLDGKTIGRKKEVEVGPKGYFETRGVRFIPYKHSRKAPRWLDLRKRIARRDLVRALEAVDADVYHIHEDKIVLEACIAFSKRRPEKKIVFDVHEFFLSFRRYKDTADLLDYIRDENEISQRADLVICVSDFLSHYYEILNCKQTLTIMNSQSRSILKVSKKIEGFGDIFVVCLEGLTKFNRGLEAYIEVARRINRPDIRFLFIGDLPPEERAFFDDLTEKYDIKERFICTGWLPYEEVANWLAISNMGFCLTLSRNSLSGISNKFCNYLAFNLPIIASSSPTTDDCIEKYKCGFVVNVEDYDGMAALIMQLADDRETYSKMRQNCDRAFQEKFAWETAEKNLLKAYSEMLLERPQPKGRL